MHGNSHGMIHEALIVDAIRLLRKTPPRFPCTREACATAGCEPTKRASSVEGDTVYLRGGRDLIATIRIVDRELSEETLTIAAPFIDTRTPAGPAPVK